MREICEVDFFRCLDCGFIVGILEAAGADKVLELQRALRESILSYRTHKLKCWPEPFQSMVDGKKTFEFRRDDRGFAVGDLLDLREWNPGNPGSHPGYTGRVLPVTVTYILRSSFGVPDGYVVMAVAPVRTSK